MSFLWAVAPSSCQNQLACQSELWSSTFWGPSLPALLKGSSAGRRCRFLEIKSTLADFWKVHGSFLRPAQEIWVIFLPHKPLIDSTALRQKPWRNYQRQVHSAAPKNIPKHSLKTPRQPSPKKVVYPQSLPGETLPPCLTQKIQRELQHSWKPK